MNGEIFQYKILRLLLMTQNMINERLTTKSWLSNTNKMAQTAKESITDNEIYYKKNNIKTKQDENYTILKQNEFDGFCLD